MPELFDFSSTSIANFDSGGYGKNIEIVLRDANGKLIGKFTSWKAAEICSTYLEKERPEIPVQ